ncbi:hypothetical protein E6P09_18160 (plasmid) [Haloferax mediterranei ATCC 33500]|uniref:ABC transporter n=1 Tax=Haloferax mediterranei (strain ATCC 33500 / DSM 1411 / JCM 8866 / NBRC 14739 / NCIMB 2177 / R-4) TaxID=523841 RepID=I3RA32_HALMT|nr:hypothetical protein [Haloferax mediterranei]AFK21092.1 hypothetical protein HFX_5260 [Haloferax mediterranei ATCC 33500]AHZ24320.1 hypothetical protein BM92_19165 [Haloferax mediterranei ATCC 33500]EMA05406.1 hypothetical protein C439_01365 [Haloferax mediterranei ATCC 33500]MDX5989796.1 hypothetical protein [Haloferax mediterranei ATCC 33500]QCQ77240.1 hypothetical protein E6P09_18160 [Haloferax mediterranei ATCC 33500]
MGDVRTAVLFARASLVKSLTVMKRYHVNTLGRILTIYMFFAVMVFGGRAVAPNLINDSLTGIVVGFFIWTIAVGSYSSVASDLSREAQWGTLELLSMSPVGLGSVMVIKSLVNMFISFVFGFVVLVLMLLTSGAQISVDLVSVVPLAVLSVLPVLGIGFFMGGLALLYKRVSSIFNIMQFALLALIALSPEVNPLVKYLPLTLGSNLITRVMEHGTSITALPVSSLVTLCVVAGAYLAVGYLAFSYFQTKARQRGVLGHY